MPPFLQGMSAPLDEGFITVPTTPDGHTWQTTPFCFIRFPCWYLWGEQVGQAGPSPGARSDRLCGCQDLAEVVLLLARQPPWKTPLLAIGKVIKMTPRAQGVLARQKTNSGLQPIAEAVLCPGAHAPEAAQASG